MRRKMPRLPMMMQRRRMSPNRRRWETSGSLGSRVLAGLVDAGVVGMLVAVFAVGAHLIV